MRWPAGVLVGKLHPEPGVYTHKARAVPMINPRTIVLALILSCAVSSQAIAECAELPVCSLAGGGIEFVGTLVSIKDEVYRFRVDERFRGVSGKFIDVMAILTEDGPAGFSGVGRQYLVNARAFPYLPGHPPVMMGCGSDMYVLPWAQAVVDQIRRERRSLPVATVYGSLIRTMAGRDETFDSGYLRSLPGIAVRLQSGERTFETTTTANGTYAFQRLPPGTYRISARLPASLKAVDHNLEEPPDRVKVESGSCYRVNVPVIPTTKISGRVVGPDGQARRNTHVSVFRADRYTDGVEGTQARQNDGRPFEFSGLAPGDYVLVFGNDSSKDGIDPDNAFPETFYPAAPDRRRSTVIHLAEGQQILNADIYLPGALPTRRLMVTVRWRGPRPPDTHRRASRGTAADAESECVRRYGPGSIFWPTGCISCVRRHIARVGQPRRTRSPSTDGTRRRDG